MDRGADSAVEIDSDTSRSYVIMMNGGPISWKSVRQKSVSLTNAAPLPHRTAPLPSLSLNPSTPPVLPIFQFGTLILGRRWHCQKKPEWRTFGAFPPNPHPTARRLISPIHESCTTCIIGVARFEGLPRYSYNAGSAGLVGGDWLPGAQ